MKTQHQVHFSHAKSMEALDPESVDLIVTSPPYPMIEMWDELFFGLSPFIQSHFQNRQYDECFRLMHAELSACWQECARVLRPGGIACINIGDATRTLNGNFQLWSNHTEISRAFVRLGLQPLPLILWRKSTNKPNKFMGSGMLPPNAYVTLEHEYILIFRKGGKREFSDAAKARRHESAVFWEERNQWFSDVWFGLTGVKQKMGSDKKDLRDRSAAFPLELPIRLISMFSVYEDTVLDPFWGTGTTSLAGMILGRNSVGYEINREFGALFEERLTNLAFLSMQNNHERLARHNRFVSDWGKAPKHQNPHYGFGVVTSQERKIRLCGVAGCRPMGDSSWEVEYEEALRQR